METENLSLVCMECNKETEKLTYEKIRAKAGLFCDDCIGDWQDYIDNYIAEAKGK